MSTPTITGVQLAGSHDLPLLVVGPSLGTSATALWSSVAALLGPVASSLPDGSRVLVAAGEFTSVSFPFAAHHARGVTVTEAPLEWRPVPQNTAFLGFFRFKEWTR